eukprot:g9170.t1
MASETVAARGSSALGRHASLAPSVDRDNRPPTTAGASEGKAAAEDAPRSLAASKMHQPARSSASLAFPSVAPAYDASLSPAPAPLFGALAPSPALPATATPSQSSVPGVRPARRPSTATVYASPNAAQNRRRSSRGSSVFGERESMLERRAAEAQAALEMADQLKAEIDAVEEQVLRVERGLEDVQRAVASGGAYRGKTGEALAAEEQRLARKERLLRQEKGQLREERLEHLRSRSYVNQQRRGSEVAAKPRRVSFIMTQAHVDDPAEERAEQERVAQIEGMITRRLSIMSSNAGSDRASGEGAEGDLQDNSAVKTIFPREEDARLLVRLQAFGLPVLVGTLLSGFTLVLFDVATTTLARRLAVLAFALEIASSTFLCLIMFRGQQLYSHATDVKPRARKFLRSMCNMTILCLVMFSLGAIAFVVSFVVQASSEMGDSWLAVLAVVLCPTVLGAVLMAASTEEVNRFSLPPACVDATE